MCLCVRKELTDLLDSEDLDFYLKELIVTSFFDILDVYQYCAVGSEEMIRISDSAISEFKDAMKDYIEKKYDGE